MDSEIKKIYDERAQLIQDTCNHKDCERVPIMANMVTWPIAYAGRTMHEMHEDLDLYAETWSGYFKDFPADCTFIIGANMMVPELEALGAHSYFISPDGVTLQHQQKCEMKAEEYPELIKDPEKFLIDKLSLRRFDNLNGDEAEVKQALINAMLQGQRASEGSAKTRKACVEKYGIVPMRSSANVASPFDIIFDRLRGFRETLVDIRRRPEEVAAATEVLSETCEAPLRNIKEPFPYSGSTPHAPTYLNPKLFEKYYWPTYSKYLKMVADQGSKTLINMEGDWTLYYDLLNDLPQYSIIGMIEDADPFEAKKLLGQKQSIVIGVPLSRLKFDSKEDCVDYARRLLEETAGDSGVIFSTDKNLLSAGDVNVENYKAVLEFVRDWRK